MLKLTARIWMRFLSFSSSMMLTYLSQTPTLDIGYVSVKAQSKILIRKTDRWKYIKKNVFLNGQYFDMVYLIL